MKKLYILLIGIAALIIASCTQEDITGFLMPDSRLNFQYFDANGDEVVDVAEMTDEMRIYPFSFVYSGLNAERDTIWLPATTMGVLSSEARPYALRQIQVEGVLNAQPGVHYVSFNDPEVQNLYQVPSDSNHVLIPLILLRDVSLKDTTVILEFGFAENAYFKPGYAEWATRVVEISDRLMKPSNWDMLELDVYYFGVYGEVKHQLMIEWTGQTWDDAYIEEFINGDYAYQNYLVDYCVKRLKEENAKRIAAGGDVYREKDGTPVDFDKSYY